VEEASKLFGVTQKQMDEKLDGIYMLLTQWNSGSELGSAQQPQRPFTTSPTPPPHPNTNPGLTIEELAFLKRQESCRKK
jgi:hypothetical protein